MPADYYRADTENGDHIDDPSEDALYMLLEDLEQPGNTFLTVRPATQAQWSISVTLRPDGRYEVERRDDAPERSVESDISIIAQDLTIWMAARG